jgi:hypothetical protein
LPFGIFHPVFIAEQCANCRPKKNNVKKAEEIQERPRKAKRVAVPKAIGILWEGSGFWPTTMHSSVLNRKQKVKKSQEH